MDKSPTDMRRLFVQMRRTRIREAQELGEMAGMAGVVRALSDDEWGVVQEYRRRRARGAM